MPTTWLGSAALYLFAIGVIALGVVAVTRPQDPAPLPPAPTASAEPSLVVVWTLESGLPMRDGVHYYAPVEIVHDPIGHHCFLRSFDPRIGHTYLLLPEHTPDCR